MWTARTTRVLLGGSKAGLNSVTRTSVGGGYKFACNYTVEGRTLKFDLIAKGYQGGTVTGAACCRYGNQRRGYSGDGHEYG